MIRKGLDIMPKVRILYTKYYAEYKKKGKMHFYLMIYVKITITVWSKSKIKAMFGRKENRKEE